jgi:hypothetical protein
MARVYVSSTIVDLAAERQAVIHWLVAAQHQVVHSYRPSSDTVRDGCLADVDTCDLYVLILGHRYGFQPPKDNPGGLSITHLEFRRARDKGKPRVALLRTSIPDISLSDMADPPRLALVQAFRDEVAVAVRAAEFGDLRGLVEGLSTGVQAELEKQSVAAMGAAADLQANKWRFTHAAMCRRAAAVMVDIVRLLMVRSSPLAHSSNFARYDEFLKIAQDHFEDLRHSISALPAIGDSRQYEKSQAIELRIRWLLRTFAQSISTARVSPHEIETVQEAMNLTFEYFKLYSGPPDDALEATITLALENRTACPSINADADAVFRTRQRLQTMVISMHERNIGPGILMDVDLELAVRYFAIDCHLLDVIHRP